MNIYECTSLSEKNEGQINEILNNIIDINIEYRNILSMDSNLAFGTEIEFISPYQTDIRSDIVKNFDFKKISNLIKEEKNYSKWNIEYEQACYGGESTYEPLEISSKILKNNEQNLKELKYLFSYLFNFGACTNLNCGNHIHYDISVLKNKYKYYERFLKFFSVYEPIIYMFSCGELSFLRDDTFRYTQGISNDYYNLYNSDKEKCIETLKNTYNEKKNCIRFTDFDTIEIRTPMGTINPVINQNYILFFYKIFEYITSENYDEDKINNKFNMIKDRNIYLVEYMRFKRKDVLELADILYDDNLDKIYFLKQCLKLYNKNDIKYSNIHNVNMDNNMNNILKMIK